MEIIIFSQHYWPETFRIKDQAESLVKFGNSVTALCGLPNYPKGYIFPEYKHGKNRVQNHHGVNIIRAKEIGRRHGVFFRTLNYWSFKHYGSKLAKKIKDDFDVVFINELSPITSSIPGLIYAKKHHKPVVMYEMDLWPESLLAGGVKKDSFIYKHYKKVSAKIYSSCNKILVSTKEHIDYIKALPGCSNLDIEYLAQYAESIFEESNYGDVDNGVIDLMFAGNVGKAQSVETIIRAAALLKDNPNFKFHIVGSGSEFEDVKRLASTLNANNVVFYGQRPLSEMPKLYETADAMLVTLEDKEFANLTIPGKVQSYMAVGKPIIGAINGSCHNFIINNKCGYACGAEDYHALADLISKLSVQDLRNIGKKSREVYFKKYKKDHFIDKLNNCLQTIAKK